MCFLLTLIWFSLINDNISMEVLLRKCIYFATFVMTSPRNQCKQHCLFSMIFFYFSSDLHTKFQVTSIYGYMGLWPTQFNRCVIVYLKILIDRSFDTSLHPFFSMIPFLWINIFRGFANQQVNFKFSHCLAMHV